MDMTINTALSGLQTISTRQAVAAHNVANVNTPGFSEQNVVQTELPQNAAGVGTGTRVAAIRRTPNLDAANSNTDLASQQVNQLQNKAEFKADLSVIKAKDRMMQELLNLVA